MRLSPIVNPLTGEHREMDGLLCFYGEAAIYVTVTADDIEASYAAIEQGGETCDVCAIATGAKQNLKAPHAHVYASRAWVAMPVPAAQGGRRVEGRTGHWGMFGFSLRTSAERIVDAFDAAVLSREDVLAELKPMRPSQRADGKLAQRVRLAERTAAGEAPKPYVLDGAYRGPRVATTRDYRGRSNQ